jgi:hypothetical protein
MVGCNRKPSQANLNEGETMLAYRMLVPALVLAISAPAAAAQDKVPAVLQDLKPHQIVEAVLAERQELGLTSLQERKLDSMHLAIRSEPHRYRTTPSPGKAHRNTRMQPMISDQKAFDEALTVLTPEQRTRALARFTDAEYRLPAELQRGQAASNRRGEPLGRHAPGAGPAEESTESADSATDPLQHHGGEAPQAAAQDEGGKPTDPVTHRP